MHIIEAADWHAGFRAAFPWFMATAVVGILAAVVHEVVKHLEEKYPHLKREAEQRREQRRKRNRKGRKND